MRKLISITLAIVFMAAIGGMPANGSDFRDTPQFGMKAGVNYSNLYDTKGEAFNADPIFGFAAGVFISIPIGRYIGVQPEILFSQKGFQAHGTVLGSPYRFTRTTSYLDVPLLFAMKPAAFLTLLIGPQYSYLMNQTDVFTLGALSVVEVQEFKNDNITKNTFCFLGGFDINAGHLIGWDISDNNGDGTSTNPRYKNVWYQATIGFRF